MTHLTRRGSTEKPFRGLRPAANHSSSAVLRTRHVSSHRCPVPRYRADCLKYLNPYRGVFSFRGLIVPKAYLVDEIRNDVLLKQQAALQSLQG